MEIKVPELSLVVLVGPSGAGKSSFARKYFKRTEIISSDECRALVSDDETNQGATDDAFELLHFIAGKRLKSGLLTVIDATNVTRDARKALIQLARQFHVLPVAIVLDLPEEVCEARNAQREDRNFGGHVIRKQKIQLKKSIKGLKDEGFRQVYLMKSEVEVEAVSGIARERLYNDKRDESGPFDIIGDVHGCLAELKELLEVLGYKISTVHENQFNHGYQVDPPIGRKVIFLGDLVDRGPDSPGVLRLVMSMVHQGVAYCVPGNHDFKFQNWLNGKQVQLKHGLELTVAQMSGESAVFKRDVGQFLYRLVSHYVFDNGNLVVAHAGMLAEMQGRGSAAVRAFALYGDTTGEIDVFGLPVRNNWAQEYRGKAKVVYGHTPVPEAEWLNGTLNIDTGCVFGGRLTALRYPEEEVVAVEAKQVYCEPVRPIDFEARQNQLNAQQESDELLDISDVLGKRMIHTRLKPTVTILEENAIAALEVISRWAVNPKWLIYLPPTMSPCATSDLPDYLEHPSQALLYYQKRGVGQVICEKKHMGSRAIVVVCKDEAAVAKRFGIIGEGIGVCYTRTGRSFFADFETEQDFLMRLNQSLTATAFWEKFETEWVCLDCELMPWSAKAQALLQSQYASVGAAAKASLPLVVKALQDFEARGVADASLHLEKFANSQLLTEKYVEAYRQYCWPVHSLDDYKLAPFHIMATEGEVHIDKNHEWHLTQIANVCQADPEWLLATEYLLVDLQDKTSIDAVVAWWTRLTKAGGEGIVVKPNEFLVFRKEGLLQPAVKCRGREYLRIIYGPEYDLPGNLERLKERGLSRKQSLAIREFALGIEALERFVRKEPLRGVHECVFGVLALESEEVDPRL